MAKKLSKEKMSLIIKIKMKADFSIWEALKLRLAGGKYIEYYIKNIIEKNNDKET